MRIVLFSKISKDKLKELETLLPNGKFSIGYNEIFFEIDKYSKEEAQKLFDWYCDNRYEAIYLMLGVE